MPSIVDCIVLVPDHQYWTNRSWTTLGYWFWWENYSHLTTIMDGLLSINCLKFLDRYLVEIHNSLWIETLMQVSNVPDFFYFTLKVATSLLQFPLPGVLSPHLAEDPRWGQWCPQSREAVLCAPWVGSGESSCARTWALIGGSPPLGFGWEYSGGASRKAVIKCKHKSQDCLKVPRCEKRATHAGRADKTHTHVAHSRGCARALCERHRPEDNGAASKQPYLEEEIVPSSIHLAAQRRRRLCSQLVVDAEQGNLRMARIGAGRRADSRPACLADKKKNRRGSTDSPGSLT